LAERVHKRRQQSRRVREKVGAVHHKKVPVSGTAQVALKPRKISKGSDKKTVQPNKSKFLMGTVARD